MDELAELERQLTGAKGANHLNEIERFYESVETGDLAVVAAALKAIPRILSHHRRQGLLGADRNDSSVVALAEWLKKHNDAYFAVLVQLAGSESPRAQVCAIRLAMASLHREAEEIVAAAGQQGSLAHPPSADARVESLLTGLLVSVHWSDHLVSCLVGEFAAQYVDIRHYLLIHLKNCLEQVGRADLPLAGESKEPPTKKLRRTLPFVETLLNNGLTLEDIFKRALAFLKAVPPPLLDVPQQEGDDQADVLASAGRPAGPMVRSQRKTFSEAWLKLLGLRIPLDQCRPLLQYVPSHVMPQLAQPLLLADFYLRAFNSGTLEVGVLSLSGLLLLLTKHGLGDPELLSSSSGDFFTQLYGLLKKETLELRQRARFQRLVSASLSSGLLPARFAATFAKKCMHIAVSCGDPGTVMWLLSVAYSLIQKHHSHCQFLLHQPDGADQDGSTEGGLEKDPFDAGAQLQEAVEQVAKSSLWELQLLRRHHASAVALMARLFLRPFFKPTARKLDPEMVLDQGASTMYKQALKSSERQTARWKSKGKSVPLAFRVEDDSEAACIAGWAAALSTIQRRVGAE